MVVILLGVHVAGVIFAFPVLLVYLPPPRPSCEGNGGARPPEIWMAVKEEGLANGAGGGEEGRPGLDFGHGEFCVGGALFVCEREREAGQGD